MVAADEFQGAVVQVGPERFDLFGRPQGRVALGEAAVRGQDLIGQEEVLGTGLGDDVEAPRLRLLHHLRGPGA